MRRSDREITDRARIDEIIASCDCCRLGFCDGAEAYIVPLSFGYDAEEGAFYFHSAKAGRKIDLIRRLGRASFELDTDHAVNAGERACDYSYRFLCVMGTGSVELLADAAAKEKGLRLLMNHYAGSRGWTFSAAELSAVEVIRLTVETVTCKRHA